MCNERYKPGYTDVKQLAEIELKAYEHLYKQLNNTWWKRLLNRLLG